MPWDRGAKLQRETRKIGGGQYVYYLDSGAISQAMHISRPSNCTTKIRSIQQANYTSIKLLLKGIKQQSDTFVRVKQVRKTIGASKGMPWGRSM